MRSEGGVSRRAAALAREFDESFAVAKRVAAAEAENILAVGAGGERHAVRLREISGLVVDRKIVALPRRMPAFLGLVGLRNGIVPVYDLGALLGYRAVVGSPRWLLLVGAGPLFGLAFEEFCGYHRVASSDVSLGRGDGSGAQGAQGARLPAGPLGLVSIPALTETIRARLATNDGNKER